MELKNNVKIKKQIKIDLDIFYMIKKLKKEKKIKTIIQFANAALLEKLQFYNNYKCKENVNIKENS